MKPSEWHHLTARTVEGTLSEEAAARLLELCQESESSRQALLRVVLVDRLLPVVLRDADGGMTVREVMLDLTQKQGPDASATADDTAATAVAHIRRWRWRRALVRVGAAAAIILAVTLAILARRPAATPLATLAGAESLGWADGRPSVTGSSFAPGRRLKAITGLAEIHLRNGARLIAEAPFDLELMGQMELRLHQGRLVVHCPPSAHGLRVRTPHGSVVDRGTTFGVHANESNSSVHVLDGKVDVHLDNSSASPLLQGEAARLEESGIQKMAADAGMFLTSLPGKTSSPPSWIHWSFDEGSGTSAADTGRALAGSSDATLRFQARPDGSPLATHGPSWTQGRFGGGIRFNGTSASAESLFPGITGASPRTVALWVKLPEDLVGDEGHGILSWGSTDTGDIWQLSANGVATAGELGAIRVGTYHGGMVIGRTDLRDGKWHHIAVVMYGGDQPNLATNVLLYVDGRLERPSRRTFTPIDTEPGPPGEGVRLGRNAAPSAEDGRNRFFRGTVDEVFIFDCPLPHGEVVELMQGNRVRSAPK
jgi:hypothetical protein